MALGHALGTWWARRPSRIVYRKPRNTLIRRFIVFGQPIYLSIQMLILTVPEMELYQVFCGARWNRTIGLSIISAGQRAGQASGIPSELPVRATTSQQKTLRATSSGHALGTVPRVMKSAFCGTIVLGKERGTAGEDPLTQSLQRPTDAFTALALLGGKCEAKVASHSCKVAILLLSNSPRSAFIVRGNRLPSAHSLPFSSLARVVAGERTVSPSERPNW